jgi:hypothetical protein
LADLNGGLIDALQRAVHDPQLATASGIDLTKLIRATAAQRQALADSPHYPRDVAKHLQSLAGCDQLWSFKTTGAGGEDALLLVGTAADLPQPAAALAALNWYPLPAAFTNHGLRLVRGEEDHDAS